jgi:hypothetical protein
VALQESADAAFTSPATVANSVVSFSDQDNVTYYESDPFTPKDGYYYRVAYTNDGTMYGGTIYNAKVIATSYLWMHTEGQNSWSKYNGNNEGSGMAFTNQNAYDLRHVFVRVIKTGTATGNATISIYNSTGIVGTNAKPTGAALATSNTFDVSTIGTAGFEWIKLAFPAPYSMDAVTDYCISFNYNDGNSSNSVYHIRDLVDIAGVNSFNSDDLSTWAAVSTNIFQMKFAVNVSKLQNEYLLINEAQADTGLQEFQTQWEPAEWNDGEGGLPTCFHEHSADSGSSNTKLGAISIMEEQTSGSNSESIYGATGTNEEKGQSFYTPNDGLDHIIGFIDLDLSVGGSPEDNIIVKITSSIGGSVLATSDNFDLTPLGLTPHLHRIRFSSPPTLSANTKYYFEASRTGSRSDSDYPILRRSSSSELPSVGHYEKDNGSWGSEAETDLIFKIQEITEIPNSDITGDDLTRGGSALTMPGSAKEIDSYIVTA